MADDAGAACRDISHDLKHNLCVILYLSVQKENIGFATPLIRTRVTDAGSVGQADLGSPKTGSNSVNNPGDAPCWFNA